MSRRFSFASDLCVVARLARACLCARVYVPVFAYAVCVGGHFPRARIRMRVAPFLVSFTSATTDGGCVRRSLTNSGLKNFSKT